MLSRKMSESPVASSPSLPARDNEETDAQIGTIFGSVGLAAIDREQLRAATASDETLQTVRRLYGERWPKRSKQLKELVPYQTVCDELAYEEGFVFRGNRVLVPPALRGRVLSLGHDGHPSVVRLQQRLRA